MDVSLDVLWIGEADESQDVVLLVHLTNDIYLVILHSIPVSASVASLKWDNY